MQRSRDALSTRLTKQIIRVAPMGAWSTGLGWLARRPLPRSVRTGLLTRYARLFHIDLAEVELSLAEYATLDEFFTRRLAEGYVAVTALGPVPCLPFVDVFSRREVHLPYALLSRMTGSNGMCAGNTPEEALAHGYGARDVRKAHVLDAVLDRIPFVSPGAVRNAAGETPENLVAPGSVISIVGVNLAPSAESSPGTPLKQILAGVASFTIPFNLSWHPAVTVRVGLSRNKLPMGMQIVGPRHRDDVVLQVARAFERERPWRCGRARL